MIPVITSQLALSCCVAIAAAGGVLTDCELLALRKHFRPDCLLAARGKFDRFISRTVFRKLWSKLAHRPAILMLIGLRLFSSVAALCCVFNGWDLRYWLVLYCLCTLFFNLRGGMGNNGSDQMTSIVLFLACISTVVNSPLVQKYAVITISVQLSLSYLTAGSVKLTSRAWLSGEAMRSIMHSETFGSQRIYRAFLKSNGLAVMTGIAVICTEILCSAAPWSPPKVCLALLGLAAISHIAIAVTMGLNTFVPAFLAAFPSAMFVSTALWVRA